MNDSRFSLIKCFSALTLAFGLFGAGGVGAQKLAPALKGGEPLSASAFEELAELVSPAVVNISTTVMPRSRPRGYNNDPFLDMLEQFYGVQGAPRQRRPQHGLGTGFLIREDGLIVTNNHVIAGADKIQVQIGQKTDKLIEAKIIGSDDRTDIALIKIEGSGYPVLPLGSSQTTKVGAWVAAFGNPLGAGLTMTKGIITAKGRGVSEINRFPLFQTDAPINPGNSGGPLVNLRGQVIGVNSAIVAGAQNIGFAIPIDEVNSILPELEKSGRIRKGYLGVGLGDLNPEGAEELQVKDGEGTVILEVAKAGPAEQAGLKRYDVVVEFNGKKIKSSRELQDAVAGAAIGSSVPLKVIREGKSKALNIKVAERPEEAKPFQRAGQKSQHFGEKDPHNLGLQIADANDAIRRDFNLEPDVKKPVIVNIEPGSPAARGGLLPGDVVLDVNRKEVNKAADVNKLLKKGTNAFRVYRQGTMLLLMIRR